jgi:hypothetical protein
MNGGSAFCDPEYDMDSVRTWSIVCNKTRLEAEAGAAPMTRAPGQGRGYHGRAYDRY